MRMIDTLRALAAATNSLRFNPEIDPDAAYQYEQILINLRDKLSREMEKETNALLTLEELREMDGEPVYICWVGRNYQKDGEYGEWAFVCLKWQRCKTADGSAVLFEEYGERWIAYRRNPELYPSNNMK